MAIVRGCNDKWESIHAAVNPPEAVRYLIREIRGGFIGHEFHSAAQPQPKKSTAKTRRTQSFFKRFLRFLRVFVVFFCFSLYIWRISARAGRPELAGGFLRQAGVAGRLGRSPEPAASSSASMCLREGSRVMSACPS